MAYDYWLENIKEGFEDAKITGATDEQISTVAGWAESAHDHFGQATGSDCIPDPAKAEESSLVKNLRSEIVELEGEIEIYRSSAASRRGVKTSDIYLEKHGKNRGDVMIATR